MGSVPITVVEMAICDIARVSGCVMILSCVVIHLRIGLTAAFTTKATLFNCSVESSCPSHRWSLELFVAANQFAVP